MLSGDEIDFRHGCFPRGRLCIFTDADRPSAGMLVFVHERDEETGGYIIEYIRPGRSIHGRIGPVGGYDLTPVEEFGLRAWYNLDLDILQLQDGGCCEAKYKDGRPRHWQGEYATGVHKDVRKAIVAAYAE